MQRHTVKDLNHGDKGIFLVDKLSDMTSHDVVAIVRRITGEKRVGHAGTLDPLATGLLIVLVGREFTKRQSEFLKLDKTYLCTAQLGVTTDSYDSQGEVIARSDWAEISKLTKDDVLLALEKFTGDIKQTVPAFSAVKVKGKKLYNLARRKLEVPDLPVKEVSIYSLKLTSFDKNSSQKTCHFSFEVSCSSGTYIRSLVHDIGKTLGVGAHVISLKRTSIGGYKIETSLKMSSI